MHPDPLFGMLKDDALDLLGEQSGIACDIVFDVPRPDQGKRPFEDDRVPVVLAALRIAEDDRGPELDCHLGRGRRRPGRPAHELHEDGLHIRILIDQDAENAVLSEHADELPGSSGPAPQNGPDPHARPEVHDQVVDRLRLDRRGNDADRKERCYRISHDLPVADMAGHVDDALALVHRALEVLETANDNTSLQAGWSEARDLEQRFSEMNKGASSGTVDPRSV